MRLQVIDSRLVLGNSLVGKSADVNLSRPWDLLPAAMIVALKVVGYLALHKWSFVIVAFVFGAVTVAGD